MNETEYKFDATKTVDGYGAIDIVTNFYTPRVIAEGRVPTDENFRDQVRMEQGPRKGLTPEEYIEKMDRAGIERSLLIATRCGDRRLSTSTEIPYEYIYEACQAYPIGIPGWRVSILCWAFPVSRNWTRRSMNTALSAPTSIRTGSGNRLTRPSIIHTMRAAPNLAFPS